MHEFLLYFIKDLAKLTKYIFISLDLDKLIKLNKYIFILLDLDKLIKLTKYIFILFDCFIMCFELSDKFHD